jgi:hypothetical protein
MPGEIFYSLSRAPKIQTSQTHIAQPERAMPPLRSYTTSRDTIDMPKDIQFSISNPAKGRIAMLLSEFKLKFNKEAIPAIMWIDSALNNGSIDSQPVVGLYDNRDDIAPCDLLVLDGVEIAIAVSEQDIVRFKEKTLDYENGRFVLR